MLYEDMIDRDSRYIEREHFKASLYTRVPLRIGGFITGLTIEIDYTSGFPWPHLDDDRIARYELTSTDGVPLFADISIPYGQGYSHGGKMFPDPLPCLDTRCPYILTGPENGPDIIVSSIRFLARQP
jgi:hypothetical protein